MQSILPTMLKTKISIGKSMIMVYLSTIHFGVERWKKFVHMVWNLVKKDSMYSWSRSIVTKKDENPFWNGESGKEFIKNVHDGKVCIGKYKDVGFVLAE